MKSCFGYLALLIAGIRACCLGDDFISAPEPGSADAGNLYPFLLNQDPVPEPIPTMRYQQVYNRSLFTNADPRSIYLTTLTFRGAPQREFATGTRVRNLQINLSTTSKSADGLSSVFSENVGVDDLAVFGPASCSFSGGLDDFPQLVLLDRPFRYNPSLGNLLLDVRVFDSSGVVDIMHRMYSRAYFSPTDSVSRVWATNVTAAIADGADSIGLATVIQLSPVPSLKAKFYPLLYGAFTNIIEISWATLPTTFVLQRTERLGPNAAWGPVTNQIGGSLQDPYRWIQFPADSAGSMGYYRLVWPSGP